MGGDSARVQELELELKNLRVAFEEYIGSSRELEDGLDRELADMHAKLAHSLAANETLSSQLKNMEPLVRNLETSQEVSKKKLKEEARLRRQAELAQVEIENRYKESESNMMCLREDKENLREENEKLRDECEALHEELSFKCREVENYKNGEQEKLKQLDDLSQIVGSTVQRREERSNTGASSPGGTDSRGNGTTAENTLNTKPDTILDDSYAEVLDELETVTEQLIATQQKLWMTEDKLRESETRVRELNFRLKRGSSSGDTVSIGIEKNQIDLKSGTERRLMDELSLVRDELAMAQEELRVAEEQAASYHDRLRALGQNNAKGAVEHTSRMNDLRSKIRDLEEISKEAEEQIAEYEELLEESRTENAKLNEEIACLREVLPGGCASLKTEEELEDLKEKVTRETRVSVLNEANKEREREINVLREKFKKIFKENATLREQVKHLESGLDPNLKEENERLHSKLKTIREEHRSALKETELTWRRKLERVNGQSAEIQQDIVGETNEVIESLEKEVKSLSDENGYLEGKVKSLEKVLQGARNEKERFNEKSNVMQMSLRSSRDEISSLKKKTGHLTAELKNSKSLVSRLDRDSDSLRKKYAAVKAELDVSRMILEDSGLEEETINREDTIEMKEQIIALSDSLDTIKADYNDLLVELEESRKRLCDSQEEAKKQGEDQIEDYRNQIDNLEEKLENSRLERAELVMELEHAKKKAQSEDEQASKQSLTEERRRVMEKFENLNGEKANLKIRLQQADSTILSIRETVSSLTTELRDCQKTLSETQAENAKLKGELQYSMKNGNMKSLHSIQAIEKILGDDPRTREGRDPEPVENQPEGLFGFGFFGRSGQDAKGVTHHQINTIDPPTTRSILKSNNSVISEGSSSFGVLREQLAELTRENEMLKNKVVNLATKGTERSQIEPSKSEDELSKLKEQVSALQICLENAENKSIEIGNLELQVNNAEVRVKEKEQELWKMEKDLEVSKEHSNALMEEISGLNDVLAETRQNIGNLQQQRDQLQEQLDQKDKRSIEAARRHAEAEQDEEFDELKDQLRKLTEEKSSIQLQLDDSKIALSVAQYSQERNKEERRELAAKLDSTNDEIYNLKSEISKLEYALSESEAKNESQAESATLTKQLQDLSDENNGLQHLVTELEDTLKTSQEKLNKKSEDARSLEKSLVSTQKETKMLTEELSHLSSAFEDAKKEYDAVVDELEAVNELFDEARQEAERSGREAAGDEIRSEMMAVQENERHLMKEQFQKILDENTSLQEQVNEARRTSSHASNAEVASNDADLARQEVEILKEALRSSSEQIKSLKEKELSLTSSLREAKEEMKQAQDELEMKIQRYHPIGVEDEAYSSAGHSSAESSTEYVSLRDQFKRLIETCEQESPAAVSAEAEAGYKAEGLRLKVELMDMSMSLEKIIKENALIEDELVRLKCTTREMCIEAEKQGKLNALKVARAELKAERDAEMREFKEKFNELVLENTALEQKAQDAAIAMKIAKVSQDRKIDDLNALEDELSKSRKESRMLKEEIFNLTVEIESAKRGHDQCPKASEQDAKVKALNRQLSALSIENSALQTKLRSVGGAPLETMDSIGEQNTVEIDALLESLKESRVTIGKLEEKISSLSSQMSSLKGENSKLSEDRARLQKELATAEGTVLERNIFNVVDKPNNESEVEFLRKELEKFAKDKAALQKQVDDAQINLSISKLSSRQISPTRNIDLTKISSELKTARSEQEATIEVLAQMNDTLSSMEAILSSNEGRREDETQVASSKGKRWTRSSADSLRAKAEHVKQRLTGIGSIILKSKREFAAALAELEAAKDKEKVSETSNKSGQNLRATLTVGKETELKVLREKVKVLYSQNKLLENRIEAVETELKMAHETTEKQKIELELYEMKCEESKKDTKKFKDEVSRLQSTLEGAQHDHRSLRKQLETMNNRVGDLCTEAEERGKAAAAEELRIGIRSLKEQERKELLNQFNLYYKENVSLQAKLDEAEAALAASKDAEQRHEEDIVKIELDAKATLEEAESKSKQLAAANKRLTNELDSLRQGLKDIRKNRAVSPKDGATNEKIRSEPSEKDAELRLLQDQFKKLSAKSAALGQKVEEAEYAVTAVRDHQDTTRAATESNTRMAEKLKLTLEKASDDIQEFSVAIENKVAVTEENMKNLEQEISVAKGALQVSNAGLVAMKRERGKANLLQSRSSSSAEPSRDIESPGERTGGAIRMSASLDRPRNESRDDESPQDPNNAKRSRSYSPAPKATSSDLEGVEGGKKIEISKKVDKKITRRRIFGNDGKPVARSSPFAKRMAQHARRLELNREKQQSSPSDPYVSDASTRDKSN